MVDEQTAGGVDVVRLQCFVSHIPDALYMVEDNAPRQPPAYHPPHPPQATVDVVAAAIPGISCFTLVQMLDLSKCTKSDHNNLTPDFIF